MRYLWSDDVYWSWGLGSFAGCTYPEIEEDEIPGEEDEDAEEELEAKGIEYEPEPLPIVYAPPVVTREENRLVVTFDSWGSLVHTADAGFHRNPYWTPGKIHEGSRRGTEYLGPDGTDWSKVMNMALNGWEDGERQAREYSLQLFDRLFSLVDREYSVYDVEGSEIDVARYLDGEPECWQRFESRVTEGTGRRIIRMAIDCTTTFDVHESVIRTRGAAMVALAELLEYAGHGVEIWLASATKNIVNDVTIDIRVPLKAADQPLDLPRLSFALAHPCTQRRLLFEIKNASEEYNRKLLGDTRMGFVTESSFQADIKSGVMMWGGDARWRNQDRVVEWVVEELRKQGVEMREVSNDAY